MTEKDKIRLSKTYSESVINDAVAAVLQQGFQQTFLKTLNAACKNAWKPAKAKVDLASENKTYAVSIHENLKQSAQEKKKWTFGVFMKYCEISYPSHTFVLEYNDKDFKCKLDAEINKNRVNK